MWSVPRSADAASSIVRTTSGGLIRKIARHEATETSQPPASGPIRNEIPVQAVQVPIAAPRSSPSKVAVIVASAAGVSSAPAIPWSPRPRISVVPFRASAQSSEVTPNAPSAQQEDALAAEEIAERAADEDQRAEREQVGVDDPLLEHEPAAEIALDRGERDVHDASSRRRRSSTRECRRRESSRLRFARSEARYLQREQGWRGGANEPTNAPVRRSAARHFPCVARARGTSPARASPRRSRRRTRRTRGRA